MSTIPPRTERLCLALLLAAAALLRFHDLSGTPPGLWMDEALKARDAAATADGGWLLVYPDVFPREPLFIWLQSLVVRAFGPSVPAMRAFSGVIGLATILALWGCVRHWCGPRAALLAAGMLAGLRWHVIFSRLLFRTLLLPLWITLIVLAAGRLRARGGVGRAVLLGALIGGGFYTYLSWYFMLPGVLLLAAWAVRSAPGPRRPLALSLALSALAVFAPLGVHYSIHPEHLLARPTEVSIFGSDSPLAEIARNFGDALLMFNWKGDHVPKQNIPWAPALNPALGLLFLIGAARCLRNLPRRSPMHLLLLGWLALGMAPTILTKTGSPNFLRTLVLTPAVCWIAALGLDALLSAADRRLPARPVSRALPSVSAGLLLAFSAALTYQQVFLRWSPSEETWQDYNGMFTQLGDSAARTPPGATFWVPQYLGEHLTFRFLSGQALPARFRGEAAARFRPYSRLEFLKSMPGEADAPRCVVATAHNEVFPLLLRFAPAGKVIEEFRAPGGAVWALLYEIPPGALPTQPEVEQAERLIPPEHDMRW